MMNFRLIQHKLLILLVCMFAVGLPLSSVQAAAPAALRLGSMEADVPDLQFRLKTLGFFEPKVTSFFDRKTEEAVKQFQRSYGLVEDGIAGAQTWKKLKVVSANKVELDLLARIIYAESRGEPYEGQVAVGAVVMNRMKASGFPNTIKTVIEQPRAFTAVDDGQYQLKPNATAYKAAEEALRGNDPTNGALYYFNPQTATSKWIWTRNQTGKIGRHVFAV